MCACLCRPFALLQEPGQQLLLGKLLPSTSGDPHLPHFPVIIPSPSTPLGTSPWTRRLFPLAHRPFPWHTVSSPRHTACSPATYLPSPRLSLSLVHTFSRRPQLGLPLSSILCCVWCCVCLLCLVPALPGLRCTRTFTVGRSRQHPRLLSKLQRGSPLCKRPSNPNPTQTQTQTPSA